MNFGDKLSGPDAALRTFAACRLAKLLAYVIPDMDALPPQVSDRLPIEVVAQDGVDISPYVRDPGIVARLLGYRGEIAFEVAPRRNAPSPILLCLFPRIQEGHEAVARAARAGSLIIGLSGNRLFAGLQGLYFHFSGTGCCVPVDGILDDVIERSTNPADTMRYGWCFGALPDPKTLRSESLLMIEDQIDAIREIGVDRIHPLAGSVVRIGDYVLYVGPDGQSLCVTTGQLALCRPVADRLYDVGLLPQVVGTTTNVGAVISMGAAVDHQLRHAYWQHYSGRAPSWAEASMAAEAMPAISVESEWQSARHLVFSDDSD
jgi:hypothetical protein